MVRRTTRLASIPLAIALLAPAITPFPTTPSTAGNASTAFLAHEVRLRKLHLVRPDLIPYPIAYEVIC